MGFGRPIDPGGSLLGVSWLQQQWRGELTESKGHSSADELTGHGVHRGIRGENGTQGKWCDLRSIADTYDDEGSADEPLNERISI